MNSIIFIRVRMVGVPAVRAFIYAIEVHLYDGDQYREIYI